MGSGLAGVGRIWAPHAAMLKRLDSLVSVTDVGASIEYLPAVARDL